MTSVLSSDAYTAELYGLIQAVRTVFHRLALTSDATNQGLHVNASQRAVLEMLVSQGERSVPAIARLKHVSRQHVQSIVNSLLERGLVQTVENPAHRRSPLLRITPEGGTRFDRIRHREEHLLAALCERLQAGSVAAAAKTLRELDAALGSLDLKAQPGGRAGHGRRES